MTVKMAFTAVNPAVLGILVRQDRDAPPPPTFALEAVIPIKRTFWQWLRRRPRQHQRILIPHARLDMTPEDQ